MLYCEVKNNNSVEITRVLPTICLYKKFAEKKIRV